LKKISFLARRSVHPWDPLDIVFSVVSKKRLEL